MLWEGRAIRYFVGSYTSQGGPGACVIDVDGAKIELLSVSGAIKDPIYFALSSDNKTLYAAAALDDGRGAVGAYRVEGDTLSPISVAPTGGAGTCHIALDARERFVYAADYASGSVSILPIRQGYIMPACQRVRGTEGSGVVEGRQDKPHAHQCAFRPGANELFVCDLGMDGIIVYLAGESDGRLTRAGVIKVRPGAGPRHIVFDSASSFYLACELSNEVMRFDAGADGAWKLTCARSTLPDGCETISAAAAIRAAGGYLYVSNRGRDTVARFDILPGGALGDMSEITSGGEFPRDIWITREGDIIAANQRAGNVALVKGGVTLAKLDIKGAVCVLPARYNKA